MTALARVSALTMSPDLVMPPSARSVTLLLLRGAGGDVEGGELGDADAGDDAGGADGAGALADLDGVGAALGEELDAGGAGDVAGDDRQFREGVAQHADGVADAFAVAVGGGDGDDIDAAVDEAADVAEDAVAVEFAERVAGGGDGGAADEAEVRVAGRFELGVALLHDALDVAHREQAVQVVLCRPPPAACGCRDVR